MKKLETVLSAFAFRTTRGRRASLLIASGLVTLALLLLSMLISSKVAQVDSKIDAIALTDLFCMLFIGGAIFVVVPAIVAAQVAEERRSGTLDLLRTAPLSPTMLVVGFVAGAPSALYLLLSGPLAFHVLASLTGHVPLTVLVQSLLVLAAGGVLASLIAMLASLTISRESGGAATPMLIAVGSALVTLSAGGVASESGSQPWAFIHPAGALCVLYDTFDGPARDAFVHSPYQLERMLENGAWMQAEVLFGVLVYALASLVLLVSVRRAIAGDPPARFTKIEALSLFALGCASLLVPMRASMALSDLRSNTFGAIAFFLVVPYVVSVLGATPNAIAYGAGRASPMSDRGAPLLAAFGMLAVGVLTAVLVCGPRAITSVVDAGDGSIALVLAYLALTVPIYSLFASTRIATPGVRVAFWALVALVIVLQIPSWVYVLDHESSHSVEGTLSHVSISGGALLVAVVAWRQRVGNRKYA